MQPMKAHVQFQSSCGQLSLLRDELTRHHFKPKIKCEIESRQSRSAKFLFLAAVSFVDTACRRQWEDPVSGDYRLYSCNKNMTRSKNFLFLKPFPRMALFLSNKIWRSPNLTLCVMPAHKSHEMEFLLWTLDPLVVPVWSLGAESRILVASIFTVSAAWSDNRCHDFLGTLVLSQCQDLTSLLLRITCLRL